jgi:hypothetical protein
MKKKRLAKSAAEFDRRFSVIGGQTFILDSSFTPSQLLSMARPLRLQSDCPLPCALPGNARQEIVKYPFMTRRNPSIIRWSPHSDSEKSQ